MKEMQVINRYNYKEMICKMDVVSQYTGYDVDTLVNAVFDLVEDGQSFESAIDEITSIALENDL